MPDETKHGNEVTTAEARALVADVREAQAMGRYMPANMRRLVTAVESLAAQVERYRETLAGIAGADYRHWEPEARDAQSFVDWARSRARHALAEEAGR
jgi:hypothetical protein